MRSVSNHRLPAESIAAAIAILAAALLLSSGPQKFTANDVRPECPQDSIHIFVENPEEAGTFLVIDDITLAGSHSRIPEYHDCQRFLMSPGDTFGPLVGIWAASYLDKFTDSMRMEQEFSGNPQIALAAAAIHNYHLPYRPLHIEHDFSCLYLWADLSGVTDSNHRTPLDWRAKIVSVGIREPDCSKKLPFDQLSSPELQVRVDPASGLGSNGDVPPVARWDWDSAHSQHYIGIKCGWFWCEVGAEHFQSSPIRSVTLNWRNIASSSVAPIAANERRRVTDVKGWYDEQRLAVVGPSPSLVPTVLGTAYPHPSLQGINNVGVFKNWVPSAIVNVEQQYNGKLHLSQGINEVYLCAGDRASCGIPPDMGICNADYQNSADPWWSMIIAGRDTSYHCVMRRDHGITNIPGTVRWRWSETDEKIWVRCTTGCCTVN